MLRPPTPSVRTVVVPTAQTLLPSSAWPRVHGVLPSLAGTSYHSSCIS